MKPGDKFILFTKYGGVVKGEISHVGYTTCIDAVNGVQYKKPIVTTTNGIPYDAAESPMYVIEKEYTPEQCENMRRTLCSLSEIKRRKIEEIKEYFKKHEE